MELDGHPTHDIIEELKRRGALSFRGTRAGPDAKEMEFLRKRGDGDGVQWLMLPREVFETGFDEEPPT